MQSLLAGMRLATSRCVLVLMAVAGSPVAVGGNSVDAPATHDTVPRFEFDSRWPQLPLPNQWVLGAVTGIFVDAAGLIWVVHHPWSFDDREKRGYKSCCVPAPPVLAFDHAGKVVHAWGGPGDDYDWPAMAHGISVDHKGNVWIAAESTSYFTARNGKPADGMLLKFTREGKFLMQIGARQPAADNDDTTRVSGAADMVVDPASNEVFVADGYGNNRVIVFDADTGKYKRMWGAFGERPAAPKDDEKAVLIGVDDGQARQFRTVHCIGLSNDGLVYVCDRGNSRLQIFKKDGTFVTQYTKPIVGSIGSIAFWPDAAQSIFVSVDAADQIVRFNRRSDGTLLGSFGRYGDFGGQFNTLHHLALDRDGNLYTGEAGKRVQRFRRLSVEQTRVK